MPKFLQTILGSDEPYFEYGLKSLERSTGDSGIDTRLIADITHGAHEIMRQFGLDTADSTGEEVYHALIASVDSGLAEQYLLKADYYLLPIDGQVISFNLIDVVENRHHELPYRKQTSTHARRALKGELVQRYLSHIRTDNDTVVSLAQDMGLEEKVKTESEEKKVSTIKDGPFLLAVGDIVTDAFIALREDQAEVTEDSDGNKRLSMEFGSKPPYDHVDIVKAVGNSANAAVAFERLGLNAGLVAFVGGDQAGKESLDYLESEGVDTTLVSVQDDLKSNYHYALRYGADRTILIKYEEYDYKWVEPSETPDWIYLSMISERSWQLHVDLLKYLKKYPKIKLAFQPGTFHFEWGVEKLADIYERTYMVVMNREEAALVTGKSVHSIHGLVDALHALGPKIVVVTDGPDGAYASEGKGVLVMPNYPDPKKPYDRTGAGDAFASTIVALLAKGEDLKTALTWAPINSMSVVQVLGAQAGLLKTNEFESFISTAPKDYYPKEFTE